MTHCSFKGAADGNERPNKGQLSVRPPPPPFHISCERGMSQRASFTNTEDNQLRSASFPDSVIAANLPDCLKRSNFLCFTLGSFRVLCCSSKHLSFLVSFLVLGDKILQISNINAGGMSLPSGGPSTYNGCPKRGLSAMHCDSLGFPFTYSDASIMTVNLRKMAKFNPRQELSFTKKD